MAPHYPFPARLSLAPPSPVFLAPMVTGCLTSLQPYSPLLPCHLHFPHCQLHPVDWALSLLPRLQR